ncbi:MAG: nitroreductase family protein, partial [Bergeyella zoohelcum]|nr:nitroreductase family protein [Bergeyella zoohelcum]
DIDLFEKQIRETLPEYAVDYFVQYKKDTAREWFARQLYLSLGYFLSACASMGIDSTPMEGLVPELYDEVLGSKEYKTLFAVAIGYRDAEDFNQPDRLPKQRRPIDEVVVEL